MKRILFVVLAFVYSVGLIAKEGDPSSEELKMVFREIEKFRTQYGKLYEATARIKGLYVDTINNTKLQEDAIIGILQKLDPHSVYIPKDEVKEMNEPLVGSFEGIGVQFQMLEDTLYVEQTISGGPSEKVGVLPGDRIVIVNDTSIAGVKMSTPKIMKRLRGKKDTEANIKVVRRGNKDLIDFKIIRDKIPLFSIDASYMVAPGVGYIKLNKFSATSIKEIDEAFAKLKAQGMTSLIFDLQSNGGGYLQTAYKLADDFLSSKQLIVYTEGRSGRMNYVASENGSFREGKLIFLVNEYSASASEILSGAIQDWDRGLIVGRRTFGKGLVQQPVSLSDGSMIRLTTARYYTPAGRCIQKPYEEGIDKYKHDVVERYNKGELINEDSIHFPDSLRKETLVLKRTVYGGGGIMPDYFVPMDTSFSSPYLTKIVAKGVVNEFASKYFEKHKVAMQQAYPSFDSYNQKFILSDAVLQEMIALATVEKVVFIQADFDKSKRFLKVQLKALFARKMFDLNAFYQVMNAENEACQKALEILSTPSMYDSILNKKNK
jgi:carboxyl-terminal processing protease